jgi:hypothetical protein
VVYILIGFLGLLIVGCFIWVLIFAGVIILLIASVGLIIAGGVVGGTVGYWLIGIGGFLILVLVASGRLLYDKNKSK